MKTADFSYELPDHLIARYPKDSRSDSRLLVVAEGGNQHHVFSEIINYLNPEDLLVVNNTQVIAARLFAKKASGGKLEVLIERIESDDTVLAHVRSSRSPKEGTELFIFKDEMLENDTSYKAKMLGREGALFRLQFNEDVLSMLEKVGHMPLPPYMQRSQENSDKLRYQTVYAKEVGAVAAPTAGLHFDDALLESVKAKGIDIAEVTLHVGAGTFQPVKVDNITEHAMHSEWLRVDEAACKKIQACKARGGKVVAVGTTSVRCLETAAQQTGSVAPFSGETDIFIYPGFNFNVVDMLITNFHLPQSTLLMLVSAFAGKDKIDAAYKAAIEHEYRFFSYGDAMLLFNNSPTK